MHHCPKLSCWLLDGYLCGSVYSLSLVSDCIGLSLPAFSHDTVLSFHGMSLPLQRHMKYTLYLGPFLLSTQNHVVAHQKLFLCSTFGVSLPRGIILCLGSSPNCNSLRSRNPGCWWFLGNQDPHTNSRYPSNLLVTGVSSFRHLGVSCTHFLVICGDHPRCDASSLPCTPVPILSPNSTLPLQIPPNISPVPTGTVLPG